MPKFTSNNIFELITEHTTDFFLSSLVWDSNSLVLRFGRYALAGKKDADVSEEKILTIEDVRDFREALNLEPDELSVYEKNKKEQIYFLDILSLDSHQREGKMEWILCFFDVEFYFVSTGRITYQKTTFKNPLSFEKYVAYIKGHT